MRGPTARRAVWLFGCSAVRLFGCSAVRLFGCSAVRLFGCSAVRLFGCSAVRLFAHASSLTPQACSRLFAYPSRLKPQACSRLFAHPVLWASEPARTDEATCDFLTQKNTGDRPRVFSIMMIISVCDRTCHDPRYASIR